MAVAGRFGARSRWGGGALNRVVITGAGGALGHDLVTAFDGCEVVACPRPVLDVSDRSAVLQVIGSVRPDVVVNAAAMTDVDGCELDPGRAFAVNAMGLRHLVEACRLVGAWLCHVSTDYVFDGTSARPYDEWDRPNPVSVYGRSKRGGEIEVGGDATVVRTSWLAGRHGNNFVKAVLRRAAQGEVLSVVDDQHGCPTFTTDLARMVHTLVAERRPGLFHVTNQGATNRYLLACETVAMAGHHRARVEPVTTAALEPPRPARRPPFAVLDNAALRLSGLPLLADYHEPLERLVKELSS